MVVAALGLAAAPAMAASKCMKGDRKAPFTVGWANIYSVPTWMKQTQGTIEDVVNQLKAKGQVASSSSPTPRATPTPRSARSSR